MRDDEECGEDGMRRASEEGPAIHGLAVQVFEHWVDV